jgi:hypothetical protein
VTWNRAATECATFSKGVVFHNQESVVGNPRAAFDVAGAGNDETLS